jgi:hypothetical protein
VARFDAEAEEVAEASDVAVGSADPGVLPGEGLPTVMSLGAVRLLMSRCGVALLGWPGRGARLAPVV